ncbi:MAG: A24 family peptidase [Burkholderiales bacterium]|nr:A24 family peptidase [Burkholderiales bacterium]
MTAFDALAQPALFVTLSAVVGLAIGSFLNVVIHRLPKMMERDWQAQCAELRGEKTPDEPRLTLLKPRSRCPACGHQIGALENVPVVSWLALGGKCSACKTRISARYPIVEVLTAVAFGYAAWHFGFGLAAVGAMLFLACMIALTGIDIDTQLLPDAITLPLLWAGLLLNLGGTFVDLRSAVIGAVAGYLLLWGVYQAFKLVTGKEGMGYGDFKLLAAIGAWLGWQMLPLVVLASSFVGAVVGIALIVLARRGREVPIPFGPYLATAGVIALFWGRPMTDYYVRQLF